MLRVAIDTTPLIGPRTGIGQFTAGLVSGLRRHRPAIETVTFELTWRGRTAGSRPFPARPMRAVWRHIDRPSIEWWTGPIDVVHGTNYVVPPTRRAARLVSVHDLTAVHFPDLCTDDTREYPGLVKRALRSGAHVHCDSQFVADELLAWSGCDPLVVHVVPPGIPSADRPPTNLAHDGPPYILVLGTIEPRKDHVTMLGAFAAVAGHDAEINLVVAGADGWGTAAYEDALNALRPEVRRRIIRRTNVDDAERDALVAHARALAYPSVYEGFGFPPLEAMAAGVPVVAARAGSLPEVLGDAAAFVDVGDAEDLASALLRVLTDEEWRAELVVRGTRQAARFTWDRCAAEMVDLYGVLDRGRR